MDEFELLKNRVYLYDGSFEGLLTAVFDAWSDKRLLSIEEAGKYERNFVDETVAVESSTGKFERIKNWLIRASGDKAFFKIYRAFLTEDRDCGKVVYDYLKLIAKLGGNADRHLSHCAVSRINKLEQAFCNETHKMYGFLRFKETSGDVLYAGIGTKYNQLEPLMAFFHERMPGRKIIIYDEKRKLAAVCDGDMWYITDGFDKSVFDTDEHDGDFEELWKKYLTELSIKERENYKLQRQMMPIRYREYMTEFELKDSSAAAERQMVYYTEN